MIRSERIATERPADFMWILYGDFLDTIINTCSRSSLPRCALASFWRHQSAIDVTNITPGNSCVQVTDLFVFISLTFDGVLSVVEKEKVWLIGFYHQSFFFFF